MFVFFIFINFFVKNRNLKILFKIKLMKIIIIIIKSNNNNNYNNNNKNNYKIK